MALFLLLAMLVGIFPAAFAEEITTTAPTVTIDLDPTEMPTEEATEATTEAPTEEPTEDAMEEPTEEDTEESTEAPTEVETEESTVNQDEIQSEEETELPTEEEVTEDTTDEVIELPSKSPVVLQTAITDATVYLSGNGTEDATFSATQLVLDDSIAEALCAMASVENVLDWRCVEVKTEGLMGAGAIDFAFQNAPVSLDPASIYVYLLRDGNTQRVVDFSSNTVDGAIVDLSIPLDDCSGTYTLVVLTSDRPDRTLTVGEVGNMSVQYYYYHAQGIGESTTGALTYHYVGDSKHPAVCLNSNKLFGAYYYYTESAVVTVADPSADKSPWKSWKLIGATTTSLGDDAALAAKRRAVALVLLYGCPNDIWDSSAGVTTTAPSSYRNHPNNNANAFAATQLLAWEFINNKRSTTYPCIFTARGGR